MNKLAIIALGVTAALAVPAAAFGQAGTITAEAIVNSVFSDGLTQNLAFDAVNPGATATVDVVAGTGGTPGYIEFGYNANHKITATTLPATLSDGTNDLTVSWECGTSAAVATSPTAAAACAESDVVYTNNAVTAAGTIVLWLGGSIAVPDNTLAGTYSGNITFTIAGN